MFPALQHSKSDRSLRKLKKPKPNFSWGTKSTKAQSPRPDVDFTAFRSGLPCEHNNVPLQHTTPVRRARCISTRNSKRDTIFIDLTNNDLLPALDYAFAILDDDDDHASTRSLPPQPPPKMPVLSHGSSSGSSDTPCTPSSSAFSMTPSVKPSVRSAPPRYVYASSPLSISPTASSVPSARPSPRKRTRPTPPSSPAPFDPQELSRALAHAQSGSIHDYPHSPLSSSPLVPFPLPAAAPAARVPLLQRKPRLLHSAESSIDGHESFMCRSAPGSSKVSLARSVSSLSHNRDIFGSRGFCRSTTSVNTVDSTLSSLLAGQPTPRAPHSSLKLFSSPSFKRSRPTPARRASTPPPSRSRLGIPSACPPVPALPDIFLLGPAARREATHSLLSRSRH